MFIFPINWFVPQQIKGTMFHVIVILINLLLTVAERKFSKWKNVNGNFLENWLDNFVTLNLNKVKLNLVQFMCDEQVTPFHNPHQHHIH